MDRANFEVVVIGGGVIGSSIAYHVAKQGRTVLVVERRASAVEPAASWASAGGVRRQGRHPAEAALAIESIERWRTLEAELDAGLEYRRDGNLKLAERDDEAVQIDEYVRQQQANGFADVRLVDRKEAIEIAPGLNTQVVAGSFSPSDGQANPVLTTRAFATAAQRHGAIYWDNTTTTGLLRAGERVVGAQTARGTVHSEAIVLAAGVWSDDLAASIGLRLPIRTQALQMLLSTPSPTRTLRPVIGALSRLLSLKQLPDGGFMVGGGWLGDPTPDRCSYTMRPTSIEGNWATARGLLPAVGEQRIVRRWCGLEAFSFDGIPFIGAIPNLTGLAVAVGFSGHGFAISPAVGRAIADQLADRPTPELDGLDPRRINGCDAVAIERFIADSGRTSLVG